MLVAPPRPAAQSVGSPSSAVVLDILFCKGVLARALAGTRALPAAEARGSSANARFPPGCWQRDSENRAPPKASVRAARQCHCHIPGAA